METWLPIIIGCLINVAVISFAYGKLSERVDNHKKEAVKMETDNQKDHDELFTLGRKHEAADQDHFKDTDMHWNRRERDWLNKRFEEMGERFDTLQKLIEGKA